MTTLSMKPWLAVAAVVFIIDQISKQMAQHWLVLGETVPVFPSLNLHLIYNTGAAFSLLSEAGGWQRWFLIVASIAICIVLIGWLKRLEQGERMEGFAIALILGGALGNLLDRLIYGHVIDFLDTYYEHYHWPVFNIADICVSVGVLSIVLLVLKEDDAKPQGKKTNQHKK